MGCGSSTDSGAGEAPSIRHRRMYNMTYIEYKNKSSGDGIKKCPCWECLVPKEELLKKREEFWNTRVEGDKNVWNTIKAVIEEPNAVQAEAYITAAGLKLAAGNL